MREKGQSLVEVIAALAVLVIVVLSLVGVNTRSVYNASFAREQSLATQYAQEIVEKIRAYRDKNTWAAFTASCESIPGFGTLPSPFNPPSVDCYLPGNPSNNCENDNERCEVKVVVEWIDAHGAHQSELVTILTSWR